LRGRQCRPRGPARNNRCHATLEGAS
jgi:hypothetical protein